MGRNPKYKPKIKFNSGVGAILCNRCSVIIKSGLTKDEWLGKTDLLFCDKCRPIALKEHLDNKYIKKNAKSRSNKKRDIEK